jgi:hypothetical protein
MAITLPVYRAGSVSAKAANNGAITPALPTGVTAGDLVILIVSVLAGETASITTNGSIGTWTQIINQDVTASATSDRLYIWYGIYSSGSTGPTVTPSPGDHACGATLAYTVNTFDATSPINVSGSSSEYAATPDASFSWATGLSTTKDNCLVLVGVTNGIDSNTAQHGGAFTNANLTSIATRVNYNTNTGGGGGIGLAEGARATAGAIGTWAETYATASNKAYGTFAINGKQANPYSWGLVLP